MNQGYAYALIPLIIIIQVNLIISNIEPSYWIKLNISRCSSRRLVFVYNIDLRDPGSILWTKNYSNPYWALNTKCYFAAYGSLNMLNHAILDWSNEDVNRYEITKDPALACLFIIPAIPNGCYASKSIIQQSVWKGKHLPFDDIKRKLVSKWLRQLPYWNIDGGDGANHILFDFYDNGPEGPWRSVGRVYSKEKGIQWNITFPYATMDTGNAIVVSSSLDRRVLRRGFDLSIPLPHSYPVPTTPALLQLQAMEQGMNSNHTARRNWSHRSHLSCFFGKIYSHCCSIRRKLLELSNQINNDSILLVDSDSTSHGMSYANKLTNCYFGIVPRGKGYHSFRLLEVLAAGAIPVILNDMGALPFEDDWDWSQLALLLSEGDIWRLVPEMRRLSSDFIVFHNIHMNVVNTFEEYFSSKEKLWLLIYDKIKRRVEIQVLKMRDNIGSLK